MGTIVGLAEYYPDDVTMRKSVFHSRASSTWAALERQLRPLSAAVGVQLPDYFPSSETLFSRSARTDDKFGLALWTSLSVNRVDFEHEVVTDASLSSELGCHRAQALVKANLISSLYKEGVSHLDIASISELFSAPKPRRRFLSKECRRSDMRTWYMELGYVLGVDAMLEALMKGVPLEDVLSHSLIPLNIANGLEEVHWNQ